jgi:hypothetical protein
MAANESSLSELGLAQAQIIKVRVKSNRAYEMLRAEKSSSISTRHYSS